jgi:hypothetical protein
MSTRPNRSAPGAAPRKLGQILLERNEITGEQLIRAIQSQRRVGGRIGTCMLEMEVVTEDGLLAALSDQLGVPAVRIEQLRFIDDEILGLIPAETANRCQAVPIAASNREIEVATLNVRNLGLLDEIAFCAGRRVRPMIANEARIFEALEKYYGQEIPRRYGHLLDRLNRKRYLWQKDGDTLPPPEVVADEISIPSLPGLPDDDEELRARLGTDRDSAVRIRDLMFQDAERLLADETDRDSIGEVVLQILDLMFRRSALFKVRDGRVRGWLVNGEDIDARRFSGLSLPLDQPSLFFNLDHGGRAYLGPMPPMPVHQQLASGWGGALPRACLLVPLRIRDRLVGAVYGDRGEKSLDDVAIGPFEELARKAEQALERCILRRKTASDAVPGAAGAQFAWTSIDAVAWTSIDQIE